MSDSQHTEIKRIELSRVNWLPGESTVFNGGWKTDPHGEVNGNTKNNSFIHPIPLSSDMVKPADEQTAKKRTQQKVPNNRHPKEHQQWEQQRQQQQTNLIREQLSRIPNRIGDYVCRLCTKWFPDALALADHRCPRMTCLAYPCEKCGKRRTVSNINIMSSTFDTVNLKTIKTRLFVWTLIVSCMELRQEVHIVGVCYHVFSSHNRRDQYESVWRYTGIPSSDDIYFIPSETLEFGKAPIPPGQLVDCVHSAK
ncbi:uncharacterized protein DEA37_0008243 [Paragonimus westermani]|uniref:C2H2-type domain-containing protein n=1 Tax=Paragonimus westermani TaxID=34504 RepID=A0A5J4NSI2_9TREM|nr:uncharacterized protein DEA37_0008243 [Paragonimus westermani]